jgi:hypothetical protein
VPFAVWYSRPVSHGERPRWDLALTLAFLVTLPAVNTRIHAADEIENYAYLRSLWFDRDFSFDNEYRHFHDAGFNRDPLFVQTFLEPVTATGLRPNYAPVGSAILWAPFFVTADAGVRVARALGATVAADGYSPPYLSAIALGSAVYGALAIAMAIGVARRVAGRGRAAALVVLAGTPLVFYMYAMPGMSHATSAFAVAAFLSVWLIVRDRWSVAGVAILAAAGALMAMTREQDAILVLVPAVDYVWTRLRDGRLIDRAAMVRLAVSAAVFIAGVLPQLIAYKTLYDRFGPSPVISGKMFWTSPWAWDVLFSPAHGWFFWTPLALLAIGGLAWAAWSPRLVAAGGRRVAALLLFAVVLEVYVLGSLRSWQLAGAFGQRRFVAVSLCLVVGLAVLLAHVRRPAGRAALVGAMSLMVWWNVGLAIRFGENSMNRQRLELSRDVYATFVDLPRRLPSVAWRYLFDRGSFYQTRREGATD